MQNLKGSECTIQHLFYFVNNMLLTETAFISANRLVICLKYCSGAIAWRSLYTILLQSTWMLSVTIKYCTHNKYVIWKLWTSTTETELKDFTSETLYLSC